MGREFCSFLIYIYHFQFNVMDVLCTWRTFAMLARPFTVPGVP